MTWDRPNVNSIERKEAASADETFIGSKVLIGISGVSKGCSCISRERLKKLKATSAVASDGARRFSTPTQRKLKRLWPECPISQEKLGHQHGMISALAGSNKPMRPKEPERPPKPRKPFYFPMGTMVLPATRSQARRGNTTRMKKLAKCFSQLRSISKFPSSEYRYRLARRRRNRLSAISACRR